jgi:hypothetical protein
LIRGSGDILAFFSGVENPFPGNGDRRRRRLGSNEGLRRGKSKHLVLAGPFGRPAYYDELRTHRSLDKDAPIHRAIQHVGRIISAPVLSGLHHHYCRIRFFGTDNRDSTTSSAMASSLSGEAERPCHREIDDQIEMARMGRQPTMDRASRRQLAFTIVP